MSTFWDLSHLAGVAPEKSRFLRLHRAPAEKSHGTVVVLHGGYWKNKFGLDDASLRFASVFFLMTLFFFLQVLNCYGIDLGQGPSLSLAKHLSR